MATLAYAAFAVGYALYSMHRGFRATDNPSPLERIVARTLRNWAIPGGARMEKNPWPATAANLSAGREEFMARCSSCHGIDGSGRTRIGTALYPRAPDLRDALTQRLTDGEIHYLVEGGIRLTGMPGWQNAHLAPDEDGWRLVLFIRSLGSVVPNGSRQISMLAPAGHYVGSQACQKCHEEIYERWKKTPMANVVRDPREHPDAIVPDLATNTVARFSKEDVALVYGSLWKQRYFARIGNDYYPESAQWDIKNKVWRPYFVAKGTDWWEPFYPPDNRQRPTSATCDGCHSVGFDIRTHQVAEWNVGCERCHGPGGEHVSHPLRGNIQNPGRLDFVAANDSCIQCHSQGRPPGNPIEGRYYDWPVGYQVGLRLQDYWKLEDHTLGETTFTHFADGTAHKNRMQGNDFVQSVMYHHGVTCFSCHDVHGTDNYAQLRLPRQQLCLSCHQPMSANGPREATLEAHTHHAPGSAGSQCVACHMPQIETTVANVRVSAHTFRFIGPELTDKYRIPNACTSCHSDRSTAWAEQAMSRWPERSPWDNR